MPAGFFLPLALAAPFFFSPPSAFSALALGAFGALALGAPPAGLALASGFFSPSVFLALSSAFSVFYSEPSSSTMAISAPSPRRGPRRRMRV